MAVNSHFPLGLSQVGPFLLGVSWEDGHESIYTVRNLRLACRCAHCIDEWTHEKRIKEEEIPQDIRPRKIDTVGRYAFKIFWSDGHDTGFYPFESLRKLCECAQCRPA